MCPSYGPTEEPGTYQHSSPSFLRLKLTCWVSAALYFVAAQVHKMLAEFRLIPGLNNLFDKLIWRKYTASNHVVHGQNENCDCSPV